MELTEWLAAAAEVLYDYTPLPVTRLTAIYSAVQRLWKERRMCNHVEIVNPDKQRMEECVTSRLDCYFVLRATQTIITFQHVTRMRPRERSFHGQFFRSYYLNITAQNEFIYFCLPSDLRHVAHHVTPFPILNSPVSDLSTNIFLKS